MKISREIMVKAHTMTKEIKKEYPEVNYQFQLGICIRFLLVEGEKEMVELKGIKVFEFTQDFKLNSMSEYEKEDRIGVVFDDVFSKEFCNILPQHECSFMLDINGFNRGCSKEKMQKLLNEHIIKLVKNCNSLEEQKEEMKGYY